MIESKLICKQCILHSHVPKVSISQDGYCQYCDMSNKIKKNSNDSLNKFLKTKMERIFEKVREQKKNYDALVLFSGGKDSSYLLSMLKNKYNLKVLAFSMVNPIISEQASKNMDTIAKKLNVEMIKFYLDEEVYKKVISYTILNGDKYDLYEWFGCQMCGFFTHWIALKVAIKMDIPIVLDGFDVAQGGGLKEQCSFLSDTGNWVKPYGRIHDLIIDALGEEYINSIYAYNYEELRDKRLPYQISPLSFLDEYDPSVSFSQIDDLGFKGTQFKSLQTNCAILHLFDYISYKKYECDSYIRQYASGLRSNYKTLEQLELTDKEKSRAFNRHDMLMMLNEYKEVLDYIVDNELNERNVTDAHRKAIDNLITFTCDIFDKQTVELLINKILRVYDYARYFSIDLKSIKPKFVNI